MKAQKSTRKIQEKTSPQKTMQTKFLLWLFLLFLLLIFVLFGRPRATFHGKVSEVERIKVSVLNESKTYDVFYIEDRNEIQLLYYLLSNIFGRRREIQAEMYGEGDGLMNFSFEFRNKKSQYVRYNHDDSIIISLKKSNKADLEKILHSPKGIPEVIAIKEYIYSLMENAQGVTL